MFNYYNPLAIALPASDALTAIASDVVKQLAASFHATVADAFAVMNHAAGSPAEEAFLCSRTWECTTFANIHPTDSATAHWQSPSCTPSTESQPRSELRTLSSHGEDPLLRGVHQTGSKPPRRYSHG